MTNTGLLRLVGRAPPVVEGGQADGAGGGDDDVAVRAEQVSARAGGAAEKGRDSPREEVSPASDGYDLRQHHGQDDPAKRQQITASHAGDEGDKGQ